MVRFFSTWMMAVLVLLALGGVSSLAHGKEETVAELKERLKTLASEVYGCILEHLEPRARFENQQKLDGYRIMANEALIVAESKDELPAYEYIKRIEHIQSALDTIVAMKHRTPAWRTHDEL
jgi:hypothetical protein